MDYNDRKRLVLDGASHIGRAMQGAHQWPKMTPEQLKRLRGKNIMTDDIWQRRLLADGSLFVEIAYSWFVDRPLYGLSVWCVGDLAADAPEWDHALSGAFGSEAELLGRLAQLNAGGRERIAALAAAS